MVVIRKGDKFRFTSAGKSSVYKILRRSNKDKYICAKLNEDGEIVDHAIFGREQILMLLAVSRSDGAIDDG